MKKLFSNLRFRLSVTAFIVTFAVLVAMVVLVDAVATTHFHAEAERNLQAQAEALAVQVAATDHNCQAAAESLAALPAIITMDPAVQQPILQAAAIANRDLNAIKIINYNGEVVAGNDDVPLANFGDNSWERAVLEGRSSRQALFSQITKMPIVVYGVPIRNVHSRVVGMVCVSYEPQYLSLQQAMPILGQTGYRMILDDKGRIVADKDVHTVQQFTVDDNLPTAHHNGPGSEDGMLVMPDRAGTQWLAYAKQMATGWTVFALQQEDEVLADVQHFRIYEVMSVLVAGILIATLLWRVATRVTKPIVDLGAFVEEVGKGRLDLRAKGAGPGEMGQLVQSLNHMLGELEKNYREIEAKVERRTQTLKLRNAELMRANQITKHEAQVKDEFLANMGHEIRTPLTAILGYAELLVDLQMSEEERSKALQSIQYNGQHLLSIINNVLDIAKLDANKMEVENSEFPIVALINDVVTLMRSKAMEKNIELEVDFTNDLPELVYTDPTRLRQILLNLVGNAVKYTHQGKVKLITHVVESSDSAEGLMQFDVIDTGIGMTDEHLGKLFKPFSQGTASTAAQYGGTGLGLVISQRLARLLGGDINVQTTFGEGSTFSLVVKIGQLRGRRMSKPSAAMHDSVAAIPFIEDQYANELQAVRLLLADDNTANLDLISKILHASGASVTTVNSGRRACHEAMEAFQAGRTFDVVLLDMQMPELDGAAATARLRQLGYPGPVIILTSSVQATDHDRCLKSGCTEIARKPITRDKLINMVSKHSGKRNTRRGEGTWFGNVA